MNVVFVLCEDWSNDTGIDRRRGAEGADPPTRLFAIHRPDFWQMEHEDDFLWKECGHRIFRALRYFFWLVIT